MKHSGEHNASGAMRGERMASKRPRRGQRILSARKASQWDEDRIKHFEEDQRRKHEWIKFAEIAEEYSERGGPAGPKKAAAAREHAYTMLERDLMAGYFEEGGRSRVGQLDSRENDTQMVTRCN
jgi:hypothetical protein